MKENYFKMIFYLNIISFIILSLIFYNNKFKNFINIYKLNKNNNENFIIFNRNN